MPRGIADRPIGLGRQVLVDLYGCDPAALGEVARVQRILEDAARAARATIVRSVFHKFSPQGVSGVVVIAESHLTVHTWPELGVASVDIYTSGTTAEPRLALPVLRQGFRAARETVSEHARGLPCP